jgi:hypothetical protein
MKRFLNFAMFYLGWLGCVLGAAHGWLWLGPALAGALLLAHLTSIPARAVEARLILLAGVFGFAVDTSQAFAGLFSFQGTSMAPWLSPPWMVALWMLFASTLNGSMSWLKGRYAVGAVLGAICGPASYWAGARLGAIDLSDPRLGALVGIGAVWALAMPALLVLQRMLEQSAAQQMLPPAAGATEVARVRRDAIAEREGLQRRTPKRAHSSRRVLLLLAASLAGGPMIRPCAATELEGVQFGNLHRRGDVTMRLNCVALLRYKMLFKAYVAALYVGDGIDPGEVLDDVPKRLELSYFWSIGGSKFGEAGDGILARNVDAETLARLRPRLDRLNALYQDVKPGDRYSLTYVPGVGTELALNDKPLGVIDGADFAAAYFRIWLGDHPLDVTLRDQLLGCSSPGVADRRAANPKR